MSTHPSSNANILWFLPTHGDGRYLGTTTGGREVSFNYPARSRRPRINSAISGC
jgi:hypothetical protein